MPPGSSSRAAYLLRWWVASALGRSRSGALRRAQARSGVGGLGRQGLGAVGHQAVADVADRADEGLVVGTALGPQPPHVDVAGAGGNAGDLRRRVVRRLGEG